MPINRYFACSTWLVLALVAPAYAADPAKAVADVRVVPRYNEWPLVAPEQREILSKVVKMPATDRDQLLQSDDARLRGIGIFIAEQQGDLAALLSLSALLADNRPTVACAAPVAQAGEYHVRDQTVADYLTTVYQEWFGVDVDKDKKRFDDLLGPMKDQPKNLVQPWIVRLRRAQADEKEVAKIKTEVAELPEDVRWAVVTLGYNSNLYTQAEAATLLAKLSETTRATVRNREKLLPNEPLFRSTSFRDAAVRQYEELVKP
ncbi:MAG TPA: hypothetical protein VMV94_11365 [Phycisphaerae bacterium]|nr:hypothetical protein [Phycisphaerae bacterium]